MVSTLTNAGTVITKIFRDLNLDHAQWINSAYEWMGEALQFIGTSVPFEQKARILDVVGFKAYFPSDLLTLIGVFYSPDATKDNFESLIKIPLQYNSAISHIGRSPELFSRETTPFPDHIYEGYQVASNHIFTTYETGVVGIVYTGFTVDEQGLPMIPDHVSFHEAILWYIIMKMILGGWQHPSSEINYTFARSEWLRYCTQARGIALYPSIPQMDEILKNWVKMANIGDRFLSAFSRLDYLEVSDAYGVGDAELRVNLLNPQSNP